MSPKHRNAMTTLALMAALGANTRTTPKFQPKKESKLIFSKEELAILAEFDEWQDQREARKAKKRYVNALREQYVKAKTNGSQT